MAVPDFPSHTISVERAVKRVSLGNMSPQKTGGME